jgi:acetolactate synthase-1/2/3 large subunit
LVAAARIAAATGAKVIGETFPTRLQRGAGLPPLDRLGYLAEFATAQLAGVRHLVLVDTKAPASFFAYPEKPSSLVPDDCEVHVLANGPDDAEAALEQVADAVGAATAEPVVQAAHRPDRPTGPISGATIADALGALLPEGAIVADEAQTGGLWAAGATAGSPRHDWLTLTGGAIGMGMPLATGAAIACPDRAVVNLEADGSAMYTLQALWTQAREGLDVTTIVFANRSYAILNLELSRVGVETPGPTALSMLDLTRPDLDFVALARGMGVAATRPEDSEAMTRDLERAIAEPGPHLIEAVLPAGF